MEKNLTETAIEEYRKSIDESKFLWSEKWDGRIEELSHRLRQAEFDVTHIWKKGKVQAIDTIGTGAVKKFLWKRLMEQGLEEDITEIRFSGQKITIQFNMGSPIKREKREKDEEKTSAGHFEEGLIEMLNEGEF